MKFVSYSKNPYEKQMKVEKKENVSGKFVSKSKAGTIRMFTNNTANIKGRKVAFKKV